MRQGCNIYLPRAPTFTFPEFLQFSGPFHMNLRTNTSFQKGHPWCVLISVPLWKATCPVPATFASASRMFGSVLTYLASLRLLWGLALFFTVWGIFSPTVSSVRLWYGYTKAIAFCILLSYQVRSLFSAICPLSLCVFLVNSDTTCQQNMLCFFPALPVLSPALVCWHWLINLCSITCSELASRLILRRYSIPKTLPLSQSLWHCCLSNPWVFWGDHFI